MRLKDLKEHVKLSYTSYSEDEMLKRSAEFSEEMWRRRTVRDFSTRAIPKQVIDDIVKTAASAPSGANKQPWTYCVVSSPEIKAQIREAAEIEEQENYSNRMGSRWLEDLKNLGTDHLKEFLVEAPSLIVVFKRIYELDKNGGKHNNYYVNESVGISVGLLLAAIQHAGLVAVTHTPSPMNFLARVLKRPDNERAYLLIPVGYPKEDVVVPDIKRKNLEEVRVNYD